MLISYQCNLGLFHDMEIIFAYHWSFVSGIRSQMASNCPCVCACWGTGWCRCWEVIFLLLSWTSCLNMQVDCWWFGTPWYSCNCNIRAKYSLYLRKVNMSGLAINSSVVFCDWDFRGKKISPHWILFMTVTTHFIDGLVRNWSWVEPEVSSCTFQELIEEQMER